MQESEITALLQQWRQGGADADDKLLSAVYDDLRRIARQYLLKERPGHSFKSTDLVHETYLRLNDQTRMEWQSREQFFALAATFMRRALADRARRKRALKRGAGEAPVPLENARPSAREPDLTDSLDVDGALTRLEESSERQFKVVQLKFFLGLTIDEVAMALDIGPATVKRDWAAAMSFLADELRVCG